MNLTLVKKLCAEHKLRWTNHIFLRLVQRGISMEDVQKAIMNGEEVEDYPNDYPFPSCLILGYRSLGSALHIVCAVNDTETELWLITAYIPDDRWMDDLKTRKEES